MQAVKTKEEAVQLTTTLQDMGQSIEARCAACDAILALTKSDAACAILCSAGGIHAVINALKGAVENEGLLKGTVLTLRNLYRFDSKLTSIVVRLQEGIGALLEALREHIHCNDTELLFALLTILSDVSHNATNVQVLVKENGTAVILASVLAHLKNDQLLLPALNLLVNISRQPVHIATLVREGGVPAVLAAILAHLRRVDVLRPALIVLRNIVADEASAMRLGGQGAYRIVFAVIQTHATVEQLDLIRLGAAVLWRIHHARCPPTQLLHSQVAFEVTLDHNGNALGAAAGGATGGSGGAGGAGGAVARELSSNYGPAGARGLLSMARAAAAEEADDLDDEAGDSAGEADDGPATLGAGAAAGDTSLVALDAEAPPPVPQAQMRYGGHCEWLDCCPSSPEGLSASSLPATHAELIVRSITAEAERLMTPAIVSRPLGDGEADGASTARGTAAALACAAAPATASGRDAERAVGSSVGGADGGSYPRIVYDAYPPDGGSPHAGASSGSLLFDAEFETANLRRAVQVGAREYSLVLNADVNTRGHTQWFLFRIRGMEAGLDYRFHIINMMKPDSLFSSGMRPLLYSEKSASGSGVGWVRCADEIAYFMNQYSYLTAPKSKASKKGAASSSAVSTVVGNAAAAAARDAPLSSYYTLTFRVVFQHNNDSCYISQCYPYTYSMAQKLNVRLLQEKRSSIVRKEVLCHSYGGNVVDVLTVTDFSAPLAEVAARKVVVISARVHPGESNASWMMEGLLEAVTADTPDARLLRRTIQFKIVPMLNPDGVILGNCPRLTHTLPISLATASGYTLLTVAHVLHCVCDCVCVCVCVVQATTAAP